MNISRKESSTKKLEEENINKRFRLENLLEDEEELTADMDKAHDFNINIKKSKEILTTLLYKNDEDKLSAVSTFSKNTGVKLPKLNLKRFTGEPLEWKSFMETFDAAVNSRPNLSNIEKFTYLKSFLEGIALQAIEGFPLTSENYIRAWNLLIERYGNPQLVISSHMNNLIKLEKVSGANVKELRTLYDKVTRTISNTSALKSVGIESEHFGPLLIPIVLEKIPNVIRLQISRKLGDR